MKSYHFVIECSTFPLIHRSVRIVDGVYKGEINIAYINNRFQFILNIVAMTETLWS